MWVGENRRSSPRARFDLLSISLFPTLLHLKSKPKTFPQQTTTFSIIRRRQTSTPGKKKVSNHYISCLPSQIHHNQPTGFITGQLHWYFRVWIFCFRRSRARVVEIASCILRCAG